VEFQEVWPSCGHARDPAQGTPALALQPRWPTSGFTPGRGVEILRIVADPASAERLPPCPRRNVHPRRDPPRGWFPVTASPSCSGGAAMTYSASDEVHEGWETRRPPWADEEPDRSRFPYRDAVRGDPPRWDRYTTLGGRQAGAPRGPAAAIGRAVLPGAHGPSSRAYVLSARGSWTAGRAGNPPSFASRTRSTSTRSSSSTGSRPGTVPS